MRWIIFLSFQLQKWHFCDCLPWKISEHSTKYFSFLNYNVVPSKLCAFSFKQLKSRRWDGLHWNCPFSPVHPEFLQIVDSIFKCNNFFSKLYFICLHYYAKNEAARGFVWPLRYFSALISPCQPQTYLDFPLRLNAATAPVALRKQPLFSAATLLQQHARTLSCSHTCSYELLSIHCYKLIRDVLKPSLHVALGFHILVFKASLLQAVKTVKTSIKSLTRRRTVFQELNLRHQPFVSRLQRPLSALNTYSHHLLDDKHRIYCSRKHRLVILHNVPLSKRIPLTKLQLHVCLCRLSFYRSVCCYEHGPIPAIANGTINH